MDNPCATLSTNTVVMNSCDIESRNSVSIEIKISPDSIIATPQSEEELQSKVAMLTAMATGKHEADGASIPTDGTVQDTRSRDLMTFFDVMGIEKVGSFGQSASQVAAFDESDSPPGDSPDQTRATCESSLTLTSLEQLQRVLHDEYRKRPSLEEHIVQQHVRDQQVIREKRRQQDEVFPLEGDLRQSSVNGAKESVED